MWSYNVTWNAVKSPYVNRFQFLEVPTLQGLHFISVKERMEDNCAVKFYFCCAGPTLLLNLPGIMTCFADSCVDLFVQTTIPGDRATQVFKAVDIFKLSDIYGDCCGVFCSGRYFCLSKSDCQTKQFWNQGESIKHQLQISFPPWTLGSPSSTKVTSWRGWWTIFVLAARRKNFKKLANQMISNTDFFL